MPEQRGCLDRQRTERQWHQQSLIPSEHEEGQKVEVTQACGLDAREGSNAVAWDRGEGGELGADEVTLGMSPGGNVSWETDNVNLGREERGPGDGGGSCDLGCG